MALIKCKECEKEVSDKAKSCPNCGCPINLDTTVRIAFPKYKNQIFNTGCTVLNEKGEVLARCKQGEIAEFNCSAPINISIKMSGMFGTAKITAEPSGRYKVNIRALGTIAISKVDIL